jgi:lipopolysaccharide biosynthesis glycosyltransferase
MAEQRKKEVKPIYTKKDYETGVTTTIATVSGVEENRNYASFRIIMSDFKDADFEKFKKMMEELALNFAAQYEK